MNLSTAWFLQNSHPELRWIEANSGLTQTVEDRVKMIWDTEKKDSGSGLFDGKFFSAKGVSAERLTGQFMPYRYLFAALMDPSLGIEVRPVGVGGLIRCSKNGVDYIAMGLRSHAATHYPDCWEFLPGGVIDSTAALPGGRIDSFSLFKKEWKEETGLNFQMIQDVVKLGLLHDAAKASYVLCWEGIVKMDAHPGLEKFSARGKEHKQIRWIPHDEVLDLLNNGGQDCVPGCHAILQAAHLRPGGSKAAN